MRQSVLLDTGPLVALVNVRDGDHEWAVAQWSQIEPPLLTCESVISEACFLLAQTTTGGAPVLEMLARKAVSIPFRLDEHVRSVRTLMRKYAGVPMSVADACLVRMLELTAHATLLTLDEDFRIYRKHGRQMIPLMIPRR
ncbi:MAG: type II toxin-antitoxin system VapC family toxin [Acidobacteriota bacterium]